MATAKVLRRRVPVATAIPACLVRPRSTLGRRALPTGLESSRVLCSTVCVSYRTAGDGSG